MNGMKIFIKGNVTLENSQKRVTLSVQFKSVLKRFEIKFKK